MLFLPLSRDPLALCLPLRMLLNSLEAPDLVCFGDNWSLD